MHNTTHEYYHLCTKVSKKAHKYIAFTSSRVTQTMYDCSSRSWPIRFDNESCRVPPFSPIAVFRDREEICTPGR